jgi:hypothetical protein
MNFWKSVFSDGGEPSSSRVLSALLAVVAAFVILKLAFRICSVGDVAVLALLVGNFPTILAALAGVVIAPYSVNKVAGIFKRSDGGSDHDHI